MTDNKTNNSHSNLIYLTDSECLATINVESNLNTTKTNKTNVTQVNKSKNHKPRSPLLATSPTQRQGNYFEQLACDYLQQQGLQLVAKNWQPRMRSSSSTATARPIPSAGSVPLPSSSKSTRLSLLAFSKI